MLWIDEVKVDGLVYGGILNGDDPPGSPPLRVRAVRLSRLLL